MDNRKSSNKFRIGQHVVLVLSKESGWERANGEHAVVMSECEYDTYDIVDLAGKGLREQQGWRYLVSWRGGLHYFAEKQLRAIYDGEPLSTWAEFKRVTGLGPDAEPVTVLTMQAVARKVPPKPSRRTSKRESP